MVTLLVVYHWSKCSPSHHLMGIGISLGKPVPKRGERRTKGESKPPANAPLVINAPPLVINAPPLVINAPPLVINALPLVINVTLVTVSCYILICPSPNMYSCSLNRIPLCVYLNDGQEDGVIELEQEVGVVRFLP